MLNLAIPLLASMIALGFMVTWAMESKRARDLADDGSDFLA